MKLKEIQRTAHQAWSPAAHHPIYLALGTSAHQLDASFNTTAALEIFEVDFSDPSLDMKLKGSLPISNRLHSIIWANSEMGADGSGGRLVGGSENGTLTVYNPEAIISSGVEAVVGQSDKHTGPIRALDFNPFKSNLLASGANDSEIYIWDLNHFNNPSMPGAKTQPAADISVVSWNRQVQPILASADCSGKAVVWDLRKNEPIIKISDHSNRMHCSGMLWHPDVATQLVLASEDDRLPVMQMWDLRFATSPLKVFENHTRGILSISWSQADSELLLSSAKDNRILCWNPNTGDVIYELPTSNQWCFDVQWCPRNPALLSAASLDGRISVYSVMGGSLEAQQLSTADKLSSSLDSMDPFGTGRVLHPLQVPQCAGQTTIIHPLQKPPKWVRRPVGASFAFGGKLIMFENPKLTPAQRPHPVPRQVFVSQVTTEIEFLQRSMELQTTLQSGSFISYCQAKIQNASTEADRDIWKFLLVKFENETRIKFLRLLGFNKDELDRKISKCLGKNLQPNRHGVDAKDLTENMQQLSIERSDEASATGDIRTSGSASQLDLFNNIPKESPNFQIPVSSDTDGLISQALLVANFEGAVELCLNESRYAEAILLSISGGEVLLKRTQQRYLNEQRNSISVLISSVVTQNWKHIVQSCELDNWKEALAALLTYAHEEEFAYLCDTLGARLEGEGTEQRCIQACLCYICSGNVEKLVECCTLQKDCSTPLSLEDLVEKVMVLRKSYEHLHNIEVTVQSSILAEKLTYYAGILAAEGSLATAMAYLPENSDQPGIMMLKDRLFHAQGGAPVRQQTPVPYNNVDVSPAQPTPVAQPPTQLAQNQPAPPSQIAPVRQPPMPSVFTPQSAPANTGPGLPPSSNVLPPSAPHHGLQLPYPQHPTTGPGVPQQPFHPQPVGGSTSFPLPDASIPSTNLLGPSLQSPSCAPMPSPGVPPIDFITSTSLPSSPMPPSSQPRASVPMYPLAVHNQGPAPPSMAAGPYPSLGPGYPHGGPGASAGNPYPAPAFLPPPSGHFPWPSSHCDAQQGVPSEIEVADNYSPPAPITAPVRPLPGEAPQPYDPTQFTPGAPQEPNVQLLQQLPAEMVEQKEIPAEHMVLRTTFDSLVQRCQLAAANPQTKRKLDDAPKRLGYLYDKLREQSLSPHVLGGLHEIGRYVASQNYQRGLEVHTQVVSSSNFSEISGFMPILKIVMTTANKLGV